MIARGVIAGLLPMLAVTLLLTRSERDAPPATPPPPPVAEIPADGRVTMLLGDRPVTAFAAPGMPSRLYLSRTLATALFGAQAEDFTRAASSGLFGFGGGAASRIGPVRIAGRTGSVRTGIARDAPRIDVAWFEADAYRYGDALAGPWALPQPVVRFTLHAATAGEVTGSLPLDGRNVWWLATTSRRIGGHGIAFALAPHFPRTVASAAAGAAIVRELGGRFDGPRERVAISHGVERPARIVTLARPLRFGPVAIDRLLVRTADYGSTAGIVDPADALTDADASESADVVVRGRRRSRPSYVVYLGADLLGTCSSILFDKPARRIDLSCAPA